MRQTTSRILIILAGLMAFSLSACTTGGAPGPVPAGTPAGKVQEKIKPLVESLYLKTKALEEIYLDLRTVANAYAFRPDDGQLSHIQKAALYVQHALQDATHQWEFLSIMEDIKPAACQDFFTLRHKALQKSMDETGYDMRFLKLYQAYIANPEAEKSIHGALAEIKNIQKIYAQLMDAIAPLVRKGLPTSI